MLLTWLALIPGLVPTLALLGVFTLLLVLPLLVLGFAATLLIAPPYALWRIAHRPEHSGLS